MPSLPRPFPQPDRERVLSHTNASERYSALGNAHAQFLAAQGDVSKLVGSGDKSDLTQHRLEERGHFFTGGFSDKQMFSNLRFKLGVAMRAAGLNNDYARFTMATMAAPRPNPGMAPSGAWGGASAMD